MTAKKQLNIRSDEAYALATTLARRKNLPTQEVVVRALRAYAKADTELRAGLRVAAGAFWKFSGNSS